MAVFVDTGAWFACFVRRDPDRAVATDWLKQNREPLITTDYVLDELLTLLRLRESHQVAVAAGEMLWNEEIAVLERIGRKDLAQAWSVFRQYRDKQWSFTDCTSKVVIQRWSLERAFAFDHHFEQFGSVIRVP